VLYIRELIAVLLVHGRGEIAVMPAVTAVLLHHSAVDKGTESSVVSIGQRGNGGNGCNYCSTDTSHIYGYRN